MKGFARITVLAHAAGHSLYVNGFRVGGRKPVGIGRIVDEWALVDADELRARLGPARAASAPKKSRAGRAEGKERKR